VLELNVDSDPKKVSRCFGLDFRLFTPRFYLTQLTYFHIDACYVRLSLTFTVYTVTTLNTQYFINNV